MKHLRVYPAVAWLMSIMIVLVPLAGCRGEVPTATPAPTVPPVTPQPTVTSEPTVTPMPTVTPIPTAPRVVRVKPRQGEELSITAAVELTFDRPMEQASVERAFHIEPAIDGQFAWVDEATMRFVPAMALERDASYRITLDGSFKDARGQTADGPFSTEFRTVGYLEVTDVTPRPDSTNVSIDTSVRVSFNRPVVPLAGVGAQQGFLEPLVFDPPTAGQGRWVNTSIYQFEPNEPLMAGTRYTVSIVEGLSDTTGGVLRDGYSWSFVTERPRIVQIVPGDGSVHVSPMEPITITFSQPMDRTGVEERFALLGPGGERVAGTLSWEERSLVFTPEEPLGRGAAYTIHLEAGAPAATGEAALESEVYSVFAVAAFPDVVRFRGPLETRAANPQIVFSSPIDTETFLEGLVIEPEVEVWAYWDDDDTVAYIVGAFEPSATYTLTLTADIKGRFGDSLVQERSFTFTTPPLSPSVYLDLREWVGSYNAYGRPAVRIRAVNVEQIALRLFRLSPEEFMRLTGPSSWQLRDGYRGKSDALVGEWNLYLDSALNEYADIRHYLADGPGALDPGLYFLEVSSPQLPRTLAQHHLMVVTRLNAVLKTTTDSALIWLTDLESGEPIAGQSVTLHDQYGERLASATSDEDGVATLTFKEQEAWSALYLLVAEEDGISVHLRDWTRGIEPWAFDLPYNPYHEPYRTLFYTDRDIYRPGQRVYFKGIVRLDDDGLYTLPPTTERIHVTVEDSEGRDIWAAALPISEMGTVDGAFTLGPDSTLGYYRLDARLEDRHYGTSFTVVEYRKPEFQVAVSTDADEYVQGDTIEVEALATYYFGGPVADARVRWSVISNPYYFDRYQDRVRYSFHDYPEDMYETDYGGPQVLSEGHGKTDSDGTFRLTVPADIGERLRSQMFSLEVSVTDVNNQEVSGRATALVHLGEYYVGLAPEKYVGTAGSRQVVRVVTVDTQGQPLPGRDVEVSFYQQKWYSVREETEGGRFYWRSRVELTEVARQKVTTDAEGRAVATFTPSSGGTYKVLGRGLDERGNTVRGAAFLWVSDREYVHWGRESADTIELVADKDSYRVGETATILVPSPYEGPVRALVTIERGRVIEHRVITLATNSEQLEVPILAEYAPNVFVSVVIVRGSADRLLPELKIGYVQIPVSTEQQELTVTITPDRKAHYQPREQVTLNIEAVDHQGRGVDAELSLKVVDRAVEALTGGDTTDIVSAFYRSRPLRVSTAGTIAALVDRIVLVADGEAKGGGGGESATTLVRGDFPDTALWEPTVRTGSDGRATVSFQLPDNLTTWHISAQAVTAATLVGRADADIVSTLDLLIRPVLPRFLVTDDQPLIGAVVHNNTERDIDVAVSLDVVGVTVTDRETEVHLPAGGRATLQWPAVVEAVPEATFMLSATGGGLFDAVEIRLPVYQAISPETVGTSGVVRDRIVEMIRLPEDAAAGRGELDVRLEPSLAAGLEEALDFVEQYPYECIEQTVSRFLPNVVTLRTLTELGIRRPDLEERLPQLVAASLQRLYAAQNLDGGWGWWPRQRSSPYITAYVVLGLAEARQADLAVDDRVLTKAATYLLSWLGRTGGAQAEERAFVLYVLTEAGQGDLGRTVALYDQRHDLPLYAKALLASALHILHPEEEERLTTLANEFADRAILSAAGAYWEEDDESRRYMNTDVRTTAMVLRALGQIAPESSLLPSAVRWLVTVRENSRWKTTQENVWAILALTDYMAATGELQADYDYEVWLDGVLKTSATVTPDTVDQPTELELATDLLRTDADSQLVMQRSDGPGQLYYSAFLRYFVPAEEMEPLNRGIIVQREYRLADDPDAVINEAEATDVVLVRLTVIAPHDLHYVVVEDPLPAGCEAIDTSLATTSQTFQAPLMQRLDEETPPWWWARGWDWAQHAELRDEKVALFADYLPRGTYEYVYAVRCTTPGRFQVLPATAYLMYFPDTFGRSDGLAFTVR